MKRYNSYPEYFREIFGERVQKLSINAGLTCPNRDGTCGVGGCTFCNALAFNPSYCNPAKSISQQMEEGREFHLTRYRRASKYLAYFQTFSNTYCKLDKLVAMCKEALEFPNVVGIVIGTRPDCIDEQKLDFLQELACNHYIKIEYGIESTNDDTLKRVNRGHDYKSLVEAVNFTAKRQLHIGGHLIFGLPGETKEMIVAQAKLVSELPLETIKFHQLQIMKNTKMADEFVQNPSDFYFYELEEYLELVIRFVERLRPEIAIERIASEVPPRFLLMPPKWDMRYDVVLRRFEEKLEKFDTFQGKFYV
ncbi:MAG: TIGR01212 family radical SAM protein [Bacteroidales bacterium]|nr:TIGR01212 family radical SAM protein [Bacteroidales bacterium]MDD3151835.1 TIGR01212 family radical SAM protein [Bacteroidales bacterium]